MKTWASQRALRPVLRVISDFTQVGWLSRSNYSNVVRRRRGSESRLASGALTPHQTQATEGDAEQRQRGRFRDAGRWQATAGIHNHIDAIALSARRIAVGAYLLIIVARYGDVVRVELCQVEANLISVANG